MRRLHEKKIDDAKYYETIWAEETNERPYYDATRQRELLKHVKEGDRVIELGAGCFGAAQYAAENLKLKAAFVCLDQSYTARDVVMKSIRSLPKPPFISFDYILGETDKAPFPEGWFDVVIAGELIEHYEDPSDLAREMARLCRHGGWITLSSVDDQCENARKLEYPEHLWAFEPQDLENLFSPYGRTRYYVFGDYHMIECHKY